MDKVKRAARKSVDVIRNDGIFGFSKKVAKYAYYRKFPEHKKKKSGDILFINGCGLPHPVRYRVSHQIEQLRSAGISADEVYFEQLDMASLNYYRGFIFYRCPITPTVKNFITEAKKRNKVCFFDVDDLVVDTKYTDKIKYVASMNEADKRLYDDGVNRMRETMMMCDYGITTTEVLGDELSTYLKDVYINRNVASDEMVACSMAAIKFQQPRPDNTFTIGYFSGSITHNDDFSIILPAIVKLFKQYEAVRLKIGGILDIPPELEPYRDRITATGFIDWRELPAEIAQCDVNIAPIVDNIFNRAKSENKWLEAALVGVPTIATNIGAFRDVITDGKTGVLVDNTEWYKAIKLLIADSDRAIAIGKNAEMYALKHYTTIGACKGVADYITSKLAPSIAFVLPTSDISGGVNVVLKHASILREYGWDVTLIDSIDRRALRHAQKAYEYRTVIPGHSMFIKHKTHMHTRYDAVVATLWTTLDTVRKYSNTSRRIYLVQGFETNFYQWGAGNIKFDANATYFDRTGVEYVTISPWCKSWLLELYGKEAKYAPNGIMLEQYPSHKRTLNGRIRILIEGDSHSKIKNTDEAFRIIEKLDRSKYHISYLSYHKSPKDWYTVDRFYNRIPSEKVGEVYADCDILIKTSTLESFSYPPLEMMATGGYVVALQNDGNKEYLANGENCIIYEPGDIDAGVQAVERIVSDKKLQNKLYASGLKTAKHYDWLKIEESIANLYK